jgi:hypothetical protein
MIIQRKERKTDKEETKTHIGTDHVSPNVLFDCSTGKAYEYIFDQSSIVNMIANANEETAVMMIHMVISHLQDNELLDSVCDLFLSPFFSSHSFIHSYNREKKKKIMDTLSQSNPSKISSALIKEYLICLFLFSFSFSSSLHH